MTEINLISVRETIGKKHAARADKKDLEYISGHNTKSDQASRLPVENR
jgi:hypothetical protein